jgi:hypothetical protein
MGTNKIMGVLAVGLWGLVGLLSACSNDDNDARADLPVDAQSNDVSEAMTVVFPDGYPNSTHKCITLAGVVVGIWTTTDRTVIWIYNDHACDGANTEGDMQIINGVPRSIVNTGP